MDEADSLLLENFYRLGWEINCSSIKDLTPDSVYEISSRCINIIVPNASLNSFTLPPNVGDRFRCSSFLASKIKELGYRYDIGYHTILYGSEAEIRRLFIFLSEALPKEHSNLLTPIYTPFDLLQDNIAKQLKVALAASYWVPWFCKRYDYELDGRFWYRKDPSSIPFVGEPIDLKSTKCLSNQICMKSNLSASIVENNQRLLHSVEATPLHDLRTKQPPVPAKKPKLPPKPKISQTNDKKECLIETLENTDVSALNESSQVVDLQEEKSIKSLNDTKEIQELELSIELLRQNIANETNNISRVNLDIEENQLRMTNFGDGDQSMVKFADLLPDIDNNIEKLKTYLNKTETRSSNLMLQWEKHRQVLMNKLQELRALHSSNPHEKCRSEILDLSEKLEFVRITIAQETTELSRLTHCVAEDAERNSKAPNRNFYTKRVLEIVTSAKKQKLEIDKILNDIRILQKEINLLNGRLDRTYQATDEIMFENAKKDELVKRAYKVFVNIHEICGSIVATVDNTGHATREIRDLEDKIEIETQHGIDKKLEMLVNNLCEVRGENEKLCLALKQR